MSIEHGGKRGVAAAGARSGECGAAAAAGAGGAVTALGGSGQQTYAGFASEAQALAYRRSEEQARWAEKVAKAASVISLKREPSAKPAALERQAQVKAFMKRQVEAFWQQQTRPLTEFELVAKWEEQRKPGTPMGTPKTPLGTTPKESDSHDATIAALTAAAAAFRESIVQHPTLTAASPTDAPTTL